MMMIMALVCVFFGIVDENLKFIWKLERKQSDIVWSAAQGKDQNKFLHFFTRNHIGSSQTIQAASISRRFDVWIPNLPITSMVDGSSLSSTSLPNLAKILGDPVPLEVSRQWLLTCSTMQSHIDHLVCAAPIFQSCSEKIAWCFTNSLILYLTKVLDLYTQWD